MLLLVAEYNPLLVVLSFLIAIFASYVALSLASSVAVAKGFARWTWLAFGALAMGIGIWSMHFVGMLAFHLPGVTMSYDIPLMILSFLIAIGASALALLIMASPVIPTTSVIAGGATMAIAIAGMHYTGMYSMRMPVRIEWNLYLVCLSVLIAMFASVSAIVLSIRLRKRPKRSVQLLASILLGVAIAGMHYTGMWAATFIYTDTPVDQVSNLLASSALVIWVLIGTIVILGLALSGSAVNRAFIRRTHKADENASLYRDARKAVNDLKEERELRDRFVSALAHDLRTPLTAAMMSAQLNMRDSSNPEAVEKYGRKLQDNLQRMDQMIQDLLDAHRISTGKGLPMHAEVCDLRKLLFDIVEELTTLYGDRFVIQCDDITGYWDIKYLRRAIENLCNNAVKYGDKEARIILTGRELSSDQIVISVNNQGEIIRAEEKQNLFLLFHRGTSAESTGKRGWGLGLTIVKGIVESHRGTVYVDSNSIDGTTFSIELPRDSRSNS